MSTRGVAYRANRRPTIVERSKEVGAAARADSVIAAHLSEPSGNLVEVIGQRDDGEVDLLAPCANGDARGRAGVTRVMHALEP
ncbi:MAG TPA: hypothetical protein VJT73_06155 [Polyangiaceae bacterium]|nr:hypothetical protein [Polyangiaceae bacterium]